MATELIWTESASSDILSIYRFAARRDPELAAQLAEGVYERAQVLLEHPELGPPLAECGGWRRLVFRRWKIVYTIDGDRIVVGRVWPVAKGEVDFNEKLLD